MPKAIHRDVFQAIADPTRRAILGILLTQSAGMTPNALTGHFASTRQAISKHVSILAECGMVTEKKAGREIYYHLNTDKMKEIDSWLEPFRRMWSDRFNQLDDLLNNLNT